MTWIEIWSTILSRLHENLPLSPSDNLGIVLDGRKVEDVVVDRTKKVIY